MTTRFRRALTASSVMIFVAAAATAAAPAFDDVRELGSPIADALNDSSEDVRIYNDHLTTLASPYMEGRVPGSAGMERAKAYCEFYLQQAGLRPAFPTRSTDANGTQTETPFSSFRDPFPLGGTTKVSRAELSADSGGPSTRFLADTEFVVTGLGGSANVEGDVVFVGYSIADGPDGYSSFDAATDLTGKIALMMRFEPMDDEGNSVWSERRWSAQAGFSGKLHAAVDRGARAIVVVNTPGANDPRSRSLQRFEGSRDVNIPVLMMSSEAGERYVGLSEPEGRSLLDLRKHADAGGKPIKMKGSMKVAAQIDHDELMAENIGGVLPGVGELADQYIVMGAHLDHLGMGYFGSRSGPGKLHPGADDNASGSAGVLLLAQKLAESYAGMPADQPRRSILFMCFSGEESGLNGSRHYVGDPIVPIDQHTIMMNYDMIGRIENKRLLLAGLNTAEGLESLLRPAMDASPLDLQIPPGLSGASDHTSFYQRGIPVLFSIIADFHADYHTPEDVSWKINRVGAVQTVRLYHDIIMTVATHPDTLTFAGPGSASQSDRPSRMGQVKVRMGIMPAYDDEDDAPGIPIDGVSAGGPAEKAGVLAGDRLVRWDGVKIADIQNWMEMLTKHEPGDEVKIGVKRDGAEVTLTVKLEGR